MSQHPTIAANSNAAHWGAFLSEVVDGRLVGVRGFPGDPNPSPIIDSIPGAVHAANRIDRPYVRKAWLDGDRAGGTLRGREAFVPVDWDTATRLVAGELNRVRGEYGPAAVFGGSNGWSSAGRFHHAKSQVQRMLAATGGFTTGLTNYSYGAGMTLMPHLVGNNECIEGPVTSWTDIAANTKQMICFGGLLMRNAQILNGGGGRHDTDELVRRAAAAGTRFVSISPLGNDLPVGLGEWIPIRPSTDTALMLAMAYVLMRGNDLVDRDFVDRCTVGFEEFQREVLGNERSPAWAERITGVPARRIERLAQDSASDPTLLTANWSLQRAEYGEQPYIALVALASLLGGIGKPGQGFSFGHGSIGGMGSPRERIRSVGLPALPNPAKSSIPVARISDMLENPGQEYDYNGKRSRYPHIRMIYWAGGNPYHHHQDLNRFERAWARAETVVVNEPWWTAVARRADIVLPATTTLERNDISSGSRDRFIIAMKQQIAPQGQARSDFDILSDIAEATGGKEAYTEGRTEMEWLRHLYETCRQSAAAKSVALPDFDRFWDIGMVEVAPPRKPYVPFADFVADPAGSPLQTRTGRIEIACETIASFGYPDCPGRPTWFEPSEYLGSPLAKKYPLHMLTVQPHTRLHGQMDQSLRSQENKIQGREPMTMHEDDAKARGLREGDIVRVFNDRGSCLAGLRTTREVLRNVIVFPTGAWFDPLDQEGAPGMCVHGNPNTLTKDIGTSRLGQGSSAQSCLVEVERFDGELPPVKVHQRPLIVSA